jgi:hypothetical protein
MSTDPLTSTLWGWQAIENARWRSPSPPTCCRSPGELLNGAPVPTKDPAWAMFVQEVRDASMKAYKAPRPKIRTR